MGFVASLSTVPVRRQIALDERHRMRTVIQYEKMRATTVTSRMTVPYRLRLMCQTDDFPCLW